MFTTFPSQPRSAGNAPPSPRQFGRGGMMSPGRPSPVSPNPASKREHRGARVYEPKSPNIPPNFPSKPRPAYTIERPAPILELPGLPDVELPRTPIPPKKQSRFGSGLVKSGKTYVLFVYVCFYVNRYPAGWPRFKSNCLGLLRIRRRLLSLLCHPKQLNSSMNRFFILRRKKFTSMTIRKCSADAPRQNKCNKRQIHLLSIRRIRRRVELLGGWPSQEREYLSSNTVPTMLRTSI